jgi:hypothetical protein
MPMPPPYSFNLLPVPPPLNKNRATAQNRTAFDRRLQVEYEPTRLSAAFDDGKTAGSAR